MVNQNISVNVQDTEAPAVLIPAVVGSGAAMATIEDKVQVAIEWLAGLCRRD